MKSRIASLSKSEVVRRRLEAAATPASGKGGKASFFELAADLIGSVDDNAIPRNLSRTQEEPLEVAVWQGRPSLTREFWLL